LIPGISRLYSDYLYDFNKVSAFYAHDFHDPDEVTGSAAEIGYPDARRAQLVAALRPQNADSEALVELGRPGTVAVVTGQQVGFCSGPAYTIFKALTAVKLARDLTDRGVRAVPVFWLATEDHDLAEVDHAWFFNHELQPTKVSVSGSVVSGGSPVGDIRFNEIPSAELRAALGQLPFADEVVTRLEAAYQSGTTFGTAFRVFLQDVLKDFGLVFIDPLVPEVRKIAAPFLSETVEQVPDLLNRLNDRNKELLEAGYHTQVHVDANASLLFLLSKGKRVALKWSNGSFRSKDAKYTPAELRSEADELSPNALLRPIMQDYILPTIAYVGGPAEIAYMAQGQVLYQDLLGRMPVIFPRNSFTLLDQRATKLLQRYHLSLPDLLEHQEKVQSKIADRLVPPELQAELLQLRNTVGSAAERARSSLGRFDKTLEAAAVRSTAKISYQMDKLAHRAAREMLRRDDRARTDAGYLMNLIYPHGTLQERFYSIVPFLAKYGMDLPHQVLELTQLACSDHMVRTV
jgi:bacillithiol biosynthesis cysteine-adding enzyme BshC